MPRYYHKKKKIIRPKKLKTREELEKLKFHETYVLAKRVLRLYNKKKKIGAIRKSSYFMISMREVFACHFSDNKIHNRWQSFESFMDDISPMCREIQPSRSSLVNVSDPEKKKYESLIIEEIETLSQIKSQFLDKEEALFYAIQATCDREKKTRFRKKFWKKITEFRNYFENYFFPPVTQNPATM